MDYSKLSDFEINKRVAEVIYKDRNGLFVARNLPSKEGVTIVAEVNSEYICIAAADYCNNPADAWPIIMENMISVCAYKRANPGMKQCHGGRLIALVSILLLMTTHSALP